MVVVALDCSVSILLFDIFIIFTDTVGIFFFFTSLITFVAPMDSI